MEGARLTLVGNESEGLAPRLFDRASDYKTLKNWYERRKLNPPLLEFLPKCGFIVDNYCAGFYYATDSTIAFVDAFIANPLADKRLRKIALDKILKEIMKDAKEKGFKILYANTRSRTVLEIAQANGCYADSDPHLTLIKVL